MTCRECRYVIVGPDASVVRAGTATIGRDGRFVVDLKGFTRPGLYTVAVALFLGGNDVNPEIKLVEHRVGAQGRADDRAGAASPAAS